MTVSIYLAISVDGLIATSNRITDEESEWPDSAWENWCGYCTSANNVIVGRKTYSELVEDDVSDILYPEHKAVISSQALDLAEKWNQFSSPKLAVDYLTSCNVENIIVGGGRQIALAFVKEGLVDEITLDVQPLLFGNGTSLLGELDSCIQLELISIEPFENGATKVRYRLIK